MKIFAAGVGRGTLVAMAAVWGASACRTGSDLSARLKDEAPPPAPAPAPPPAPADSPELQRFKSFMPLHCGGSKAPMFGKGAETSKSIILKTNIDSVMKADKPELGVLFVPSAATDEMRYVPIVVQERGDSRRTCEMKPVRFRFLLQPHGAELKAKMVAENKVDWHLGVTAEEHKAILADLAAKGLANDQDKVQFYYDALVKSQTGKALPTIGFEQDVDTPLAKLGDDVKLVTHCGKASWEELGGIDYPAQRLRLLQEFYIYQMLNTLKTTFIRTALVDIAYVPQNVTTPRDFEGHPSVVGFLRESKPRMASRCDLQGDPPAVGVHGEDAGSVAQGDLIANFLVNLDYSLQGAHNSEIMYDATGKAFYSPYDFDLSGVITDTYFKNPGPIADKAGQFRNFLAGYNGKEPMIAQVLNLLDKLPRIKKTIAKAEKAIDADGSVAPKKFTAWITLFEPVLREFIEKNRAAAGAFISAGEAYLKQAANDNGDEAGA